jgi:integrase/recombinase XerD
MLNPNIAPDAISVMAELFLNQKHMTGYKYESQEKYITRFVKFYEREGYTGIRLTKSMVETFIYDISEKPSTHYLKETVLRDFAEFLKKQDFHEIYVPLVRSGSYRCKHIPYIFTDNEIKCLFTAIDTWEDSFYTNRTQVDPLLFRILYGTGMRVSEALNLTVADFHIEGGTLTVYHAKNNKDRLIPLAQSLVDGIMEYLAIMHPYSKNNTYLFFVGKGGKMDQSTVYRRFRQYLLKAEIPHTKSGPRVHDLRHNYAVKCLKKRVLAGEELTNILPYLAAYMGHSDFRGTQYYLRLTADLYPHIISYSEAGFGYLIPEGGVGYERS